MAILRIKQLMEDLQNNTSVVLPSVGIANSGTAAVATLAVKATSAGYAGTAMKASSAGGAGTALLATTATGAGTATFATSAGQAGTARIALYGSAGTGALP